MKSLIRLFSLLCALILVHLVGVGWLLFSSRVAAASPIVTVANWDPSYNCGSSYFLGRADYLHGVWDVDSFTRDALAGEVFSSWTYEALKANAVRIRSGAIYFANSPEGDDAGICNHTGYNFSLRETRYLGWGLGKGATIGNANNRPNDRVTDTGGRVLRLNGSYWFPPFNDCLQNYTQALGSAGRSYTSILTAADGVYGPSRPPSAICGLSNYSSLTVDPVYPFQNSMTNGTVPEFLGVGGYWSGASTPVFTARQAEVYWGFAGMDDVRNQPFNQPGLYATGYTTGDKIEYLMDFGGSYQFLHLVGIADKPAPVTMNIYIDGYYRGQMQWGHNDNARHLAIATFSGLSSGSHAIAIEFANDAPGGSTDTDRNFYLDELGVTNY